MDNKKEETEEKPKAVVEMEENSDAGKAKKRIKEKRELDAKTANKKFLIKYIIFVVIIILITIGAIYYSINQLNKDDEENVTEEKTEIAKTTAKDQKYAINSYSETYNENSLKIQYYAGNDQPVENTYGGEEYAQIEGLLDKDIQNSINARLKDTAKRLKEGNRSTFTQITANYGNILSAIIYNQDYKRETINIDLTTGNDISLEDVFVSSAPLNSLIMEGVYKSLAWDRLSSDYEKNEGYIDMNKVDTSQYEEIALRAVNNYKAKGENIQFYITCQGITIYGITDQNMYISDNENSSISIDFLGHREDIAIYKRYLATNSIYENDSIGAKDIIVFTNNIYDNKYMYNLIYEKDENIFIEESLNFYEEESKKDKNTFEIIKKYLTNIANEDKQKIKSETNNNIGAFYQKEVNLWKSENYYAASYTEYKATCDVSYFKDEGFKDYAKMKNGPRADVGMNGFVKGELDEFPNLNISEVKHSELYFDLEGNYIGASKEEANETINKSNAVEEDKANSTENTNKDANINVNTSIDNNTTNVNANVNSNTIEIEREENIDNSIVEE